MRLCLTWVFLFLCTSLIRAQAQIKYPALDQDGYQKLILMAEHIQEVCPPKDCLVTFVGRSNILISAYMEGKLGLKPSTLPLSGVRALDASVESKAKGRFFKEVLDPYFRKPIEGVKKVLVVDYVNDGGSLVTASSWIQEYANLYKPGLKVGALGYGQSMGRNFEDQLLKRGIHYEFISAGSPYTHGNVAYLAKESMTERYAPFDEWNPMRTEGSPVIQPSVRRPYPYLDGPNGTKLFDRYASYDDLVSWMKEEDPVSFLKLHLPGSCSQSVIHYLKSMY